MNPLKNILSICRFTPSFKTQEIDPTQIDVVTLTSVAGPLVVSHLLPPSQLPAHPPGSCEIHHLLHLTAGERQVGGERLCGGGWAGERLCDDG